jgi:phage terminase large subunit-like protein
MAGRGFGKTRSGAEWIAHEARRHPRTEWAIVAPTYKDLKEVCMLALQAVLFDVPGVQYNLSSLEVKLPNGSIIRSYSAETPERCRGPNLSGVWLDEIAQSQNTYPEAYKTLSMAIRRKGSPAQIVATTTPEGQSKLVREFTGRKDDSVVITRGSTFDNRDNLAEAFITDMETRHKGTRFERQELFGELLDDVPGALWTPDMIERNSGTLTGGPGRYGT